MYLKKPVQNLFAQISESLEALTVEEYSMPSKALFHSSVGQHVRHTIELYTCLLKGYETGRVCYDERERDTRIEKDKDLAIEMLHKIEDSIDKPDKTMVLYSRFDEQAENMVQVATNYTRELVYNLEHTVHHMALIRIGIQDVSGKQVPEEFGLAMATIKYQRSCAQ